MTVLNMCFGKHMYTFQYSANVKWTALTFLIPEDGRCVAGQDVENNPNRNRISLGLASWDCVRWRTKRVGSVFRGGGYLVIARPHLPQWLQWSSVLPLLTVVCKMSRYPCVRSQWAFYGDSQSGVTWGSCQLSGVCFLRLTTIVMRTKNLIEEKNVDWNS